MTEQATKWKDTSTKYLHCPKCRVNWSILSEMLKEERGTDNHVMATRIIDSCEHCKGAFK